MIHDIRFFKKILRVSTCINACKHVTNYEFILQNLSFISYLKQIKVNEKETKYILQPWFMGLKHVQTISRGQGQLLMIINYFYSYLLDNWSIMN